MKLHPLHTIEFVTTCLRATGAYPGVRRTGRSTALAHSLIALAINNPGKIFCIKDHAGPVAADVCLRHTLQTLVNKLGYVGFTFTSTTIKFGG